MPKTPVSSENTNRSNPYIMKGISKTLLTPCKRVGLSRKRKTPNSIESLLSPSTSNNNNKTSTTVDSPTLNTTPITSRTKYDEPCPKTTQNNGSIPKKTISKCFLPDGTPPSQKFEKTTRESNDFQKTELSNSGSLKNKSASAKNINSSVGKETTKQSKKELTKNLSPDLSGESISQSKALEPSNAELFKTESTLDKNSNVEKTKPSKKQTVNKKFNNDTSPDVFETKLTSINNKKNSKNKTDKVSEKTKPDKKKTVTKRLILDDTSSDSFSSNTPMTSQKSLGSSSEDSINLNKVSMKLKSKRVIEDSDDDEYVVKKTKPTNKKTICKPLTDTSPEDVKESSLKEPNSSCDPLEEVSDTELFRGFEQEKAEDKGNSFALKEIQNTKLNCNSNKEKTNKSDKNIDIIIEEHSYMRMEKKSKIKRSLSMKKTLSVEKDKHSPKQKTLTRKCSVNLSPIKTVVDDKIITLSQVNRLEQEVKAKQKEVEDLKQAEIYKKLHDLDQLKALTATWKNGCISALNDLLPHLQMQGNMDMARLLNNVGAPAEMITLSENGDLI